MTNWGIDLKTIRFAFQIIRILTLLSLFIATSLGFAETKNNKTLIVAADEWCPYNCVPGSAQPGYIIEVLREVFSKHNINVEYRVLPWKRALLSAENGTIDAAVGAVKGNHGRNIIGSENLGFDETVFVVRKGEVFEFKTQNVLDNKVVGVIIDYTYDNHGVIDSYIELRKKNKDRVYTIHQEQPLNSLYEMLLRSRIDIFPENKYVAKYVANKRNDINKVEFVTTGKGDEIYVAFTPNSEGRENAKKLDKGIIELRKNGKLKKILNQYGIE